MPYVIIADVEIRPYIEYCKFQTLERKIINKMYPILFTYTCLMTDIPSRSESKSVITKLQIPYKEDLFI